MRGGYEWDVRIYGGERREGKRGRGREGGGRNLEVVFQQSTPFTNNGDKLTADGVYVVFTLSHKYIVDGKDTRLLGSHIGSPVPSLLQCHLCDL